MINLLIDFFVWIFTGIMDVLKYLWQPFGKVIKLFNESKKAYKKDSRFLKKFNKERERRYTSNDEMF